MAAFSDEIASSSRQNTVQIQFVDEEDLPLASFFERRESEDEVDTDFEESEEEEEENLSVSEPGDDADVVEISEWRREINLREELAFDQPTGPRIDVRGDMKSVDFFSALFYRWCVEPHSGANEFICRAEARAWRALSVVPAHSE